MGLIGIGVGTAHMGSMKTGPHGEVLSVTPARWETDPAGGCVAIWPLNPETMKPDGPAEIFGDWDAAGYLARALELLKPTRQINVPDLEAMIRAAHKDGFDVCNYCPDFRCNDCIVNRWKGDPDDE